VVVYIVGDMVFRVRRRRAQRTYKHTHTHTHTQKERKTKLKTIINIKWTPITLSEDLEKKKVESKMDTHYTERGLRKKNCSEKWTPSTLSKDLEKKYIAQENGHPVHSQLLYKKKRKKNNINNFKDVFV
jgi:hypothetical protein